MELVEKKYLGFVLVMILYPILVLSNDDKWSVVNFLIYSSTLFVTMVCLESIRKTNLQAWSWFGFCYFSCFWLNTLQLSSLDIPKTLYDFYIMFLGPLVFMFLLQWSEHIPVSTFKIKTRFIDLNFIYILLIVLYIYLSFFNYLNVGWRVTLIQETHSIISGDKFTVPISSGLWSVIAWTLLILSPHVKKSHAITAIIAIVIFSCILHVKRGDLIRIILFYITYFLMTKNNESKFPFNKKLLILALIISGVTLFVVFGQWRLAQSGSNAQTIINITGVKIDSVFVAWLFAYIIVQFDVFSLSSAALNSISYQFTDFNSLLMPISSVTDKPENTLIPIKGFNAGTAFWSFVRDFGSLFFIEMILFWFLISGLIWVSKKTDCKGAYSFICMLCALMIFGNYFSNRSMILAIILGNIIYFISIQSGKRQVND